LNQALVSFQNRWLSNLVSIEHALPQPIADDKVGDTFS
jgi:hypothetical protein